MEISDVFQFQTFDFFDIIVFKVTHFWVHKKWPTKDPPFLLPTSATINLLFEKNGIRKHVKNFKKPSIPLLRKRHKCMSPFWFFKNWVVTCLNADEILNFIEIQSRYLLLSNQSNEDYVFHYISYFLNNFSIDIWSILSTTNSLPFIISS